MVIGRIIKPVGIRGEVRVAFESGDPDRLRTVKVIAVRLGEETSRLHIVKAIPEAGPARVKFRELENPEEAGLLRGAELIVSAKDSPALKPGEYYVDQLIGLTAIASDGETLGRLEEILQPGTSDVWVLRGEAGELLIPAVSEFIGEIDFEKRLVAIQKTRAEMEGI